ncbi:MAG: DNA repair protein RadA [Defluviitaleaceae bacterium]|nr:DNA repair protein RadA [Defluviitaleaceae bacterium]
MTKKIRFVCDDCGYDAAKWLGRCPSCNQYNTLREMVINPERQQQRQRHSRFSPSEAIGGAVDVSKPGVAGGAKPGATGGCRLLRDISVTAASATGAAGAAGAAGATGAAGRFATEIPELDRVLGGGIVAGSMLLLGGDPGIGKSTLLLQICRQMAREDFPVLYVSGEESAVQIKMRADRLKVDVPCCYLMAETDIYAIRDAVNEIKPALLLIDSIQTMRLSDMTSLPGSVTQVRECAAFFTYLAKTELNNPQGSMSVILVGHMTKEGSLAGPRVLEHMVDTVLYFEGEGLEKACRLIRAVKNRFGSTHEIGVFEMDERGLTGISDPSAYMLAGRPVDTAGSVVTCSLEGTRPLLTEVQALVSYTNFGTPRRTATGVDYNRMVMLMAVLEKRAGYKLQNFDAYVNIAGGLRVGEPAADAAIVAALASCYKNRPVDAGMMVIGEVGLAGELRAVSQPERRVAEAVRQGFTCCILPAANKKKLRLESAKISEKFRILGAANIGEMLEALL